jgi:hypothetical protein
MQICLENENELSTPIYLLISATHIQLHTFQWGTMCYTSYTPGPFTYSLHGDLSQIDEENAHLSTSISVYATLRETIMRNKWFIVT